MPILPILLVIVVFGLLASGGAKSSQKARSPKPISTLERAQAGLVHSRLPQRLAPALVRREWSDGWSVTWLPDIESISEQAVEMNHGIHNYMVPHLMSLAPVFAFRAQYGPHNAGSLVVGYSDGVYELIDAQGPGRVQIDGVTLARAREFVDNLNEQA